MEANGDWEEEAEREENEGSTAFCTDSDNFTAVQHGSMNGGEDSDRVLIETTTVTLLCTGGGGTSKWLAVRNQAGLAKCIVRAVNACHPHLHSTLGKSRFSFSQSPLPCHGISLLKSNNIGLVATRENHYKYNRLTYVATPRSHRSIEALEKTVLCQVSPRVPLNASLKTLFRSNLTSPY
ncbi:hypothetical protein JHK84_050024 [Glycine max]|nr:hypothetical protein JHK84_050024 [Glycine max]